MEHLGEYNTDNEQELRYRVGKLNDRGERLFPLRSSRLYWHLTQLRREMVEVIEEYLAGSTGRTLFDYGCGNMPYRPLFDQHVDRYVGFDFSGNHLADCTIEGEFSLPAEANSCDILLSSQVLEHVAEPHRYLAECYRVLKDDGVLILSTHGVWRYHPDPTDYWRWTCDGLKREIESVGFLIQRMQGIMGPEATALQLWQDAVLPRVVPWFRKPFTRYMQWRIRRADAGCSRETRNRDACVYVTVSKKKAVRAIV